jgi:hypothetical protein
MLVHPISAKAEMNWRQEFVSDGMQTAGLLRQAIFRGVCAHRDRLLRATGDALITLGTWLRQRPHPHSARS